MVEGFSSQYGWSPRDSWEDPHNHCSLAGCGSSHHRLPRESWVWCPFQSLCVAQCIQRCAADTVLRVQRSHCVFFLLRVFYDSYWRQRSKDRVMMVMFLAMYQKS